MGEVEILHRIYTNAAEGGAFDEPGARPVPLEERDAARGAPPDVLIALDNLLRKTVPAGTQTGWVVRRFVGDDNDTYVCVVVSHPDLVTDATGRPGLLNHAWLARVSELSFDAAALVRKALDFPTEEIYRTPAAGRLDLYRNYVSAEASLFVPPLVESELEALPRPLLIAFLSACLATVGDKKSVRVAISEADPLTLAHAWAAMPLALQRSSSWGVSIADGTPVDLVLSSSEGSDYRTVARETLVERVTQYAGLLETPGVVRGMLANRNLSSVVELGNAVERALIAVLPPPAWNARKEEMRNKAKGGSPERGRQHHDGEPFEAGTVADLNRQFQALEKSLRLIIDERMVALEERLLGEAPSRQQESPKWLWWSAGAVAIAAVCALLWFGLRSREPRPPIDPPVSETVQQDTTAETTGTTPVVRDAAPAQRAVANAETTKKWAEELKTLIESESAFVAGEIDTAADGASGDGSASLRAFAARIARNEVLPASGGDGREGLRALLVDYIASEVVPDGNVKIDGDLGDVAPLLGNVKQAFRVTNPATDPKAMELQSEIILRWMARPGR